LSLRLIEDANPAVTVYHSIEIGGIEKCRCRSSLRAPQALISLNRDASIGAFGRSLGQSSRPGPKHAGHSNRNLAGHTISSPVRVENCDDGLYRRRLHLAHTPGSFCLSSAATGSSKESRPQVKIAQPKTSIGGFRLCRRLYLVLYRWSLQLEVWCAAAVKRKASRTGPGRAAGIRM
jgi:hypothetical protein